MSACSSSSSDGSSGGPGEPAGSLEIALNGTIDAGLAMIAIQNVFDSDQNWLIECQRKDHELNGQQFCDELVVVPPGVYEIVVQSPDPNCRSENDHYKVIVEPGETVEISINLICGQDNGGLDTIVTENHRPTIEDIRFDFVGGGTANKFVCRAGEPVAIEVVLSDEDTACTDLEVTWTASDPTGLVLIDPVAAHVDPMTNECVASITVDPLASTLGTYDVTLRVIDDGVGDTSTTSLTFPVHLIDCGLACNVNDFCDGEFRTGDYWVAAGGAFVSPTSPGNGNPGSGFVPVDPGASLSQNLIVGPSSLRIQAAFDYRSDCQSLSVPPVLMVDGKIALRGGEFLPAGTWFTAVGCLGEAAFGNDVLYSLASFPAFAPSCSFEFDNARLQVVDEETCPAIGTVLNGDMQGNFGWTSPNGTVTYGVDGGIRFVRVAGTGCPARELSSWISVPLETTMAHPVLRFDYRGDGPGQVVVTSPSQLYTILSPTSSWQSASACISDTMAGLSEPLRYFRTACGTGLPDSLDLRNVRIENDATACP